jgi:hypothetical protein
MTSRTQMCSVLIALLLWPSAAIAQTPPTVQQIANIIVRLCTAGGRTEVITGVVAAGGADILVRMHDIRGDLTGELKIGNSSVEGIVTGINNALAQARASQADLALACLRSARDGLLDVVRPERVDRPLVPARLYLRAVDIPPPGVGAYGVVAFRSKPTSANRSRLLNACSAFKAHLPRSEPLLSSVPIQDQMLTIWPLDNPGAPEAVADDCKFVIEHYDLYGGISAIQDAERQGAQLGNRGPFLIGWSPSNSRGIPDKVVLIVDLSLFESQDSFDEAFLFWQKKVVEDPTLWRSGFSMERLRLAIRDFVDHYGQEAINATTVWGVKR